MQQLKDVYYQFNGIQLHAVEAGPAEGEILLFLHGFPEFWYGWINQLNYFAQKGYRVIAPDQRGYNLSDKPAEVRAYVLEKLVQDLYELVQQLSSRKITLVGHDWGGGVAWAFALLHPSLLQQLIILNMPYPGILGEQIRKNPEQLLRSWYAGFFQMPWAPEQLSTAFDFKFLEQSMKSTSRANTFTEEDFEVYKKAWAQPDALTGMINWYRAYKYSNLDFSSPITVPTLMLWGSQDTFLSKELAQPSIDRCTNGKLIYLELATHWLHHEFPEEVNQHIHTFISKA